ncbi:hypothetical protein [Spirosoma endophyticum]|uniref:HEAT repeat-containing protein n=1 Tax=Spirosoma endophyticum TaxID=662367 RepID=A0A1I2FZI2_9BACT|nr:hypothetical protein [Spirosoma endophyticum]SFF10219.1 hypothetical protein SAMN05216167_12855 [Spirosoma endophyticum]
MTQQEKKLINDRRDGKISEHEFKERLPLREYTDRVQLEAKVNAAISRDDFQELELLIYLVLWVLPDSNQYTSVLNELLVTPGHRDHQEIARRLQKFKSPSTIPYVRAVLLSDFDYLAYTGSDSDAIAKWFSWILADIGTPEAIEVLEECSHSTDEGIRNEMLYRLKKCR